MATILNYLIGIIYPPVQVTDIVAGREASPIVSRGVAELLSSLFTLMWGKKRVTLIVWGEDAPDFRDSLSWQFERRLVSTH